MRQDRDLLTAQAMRIALVSFVLLACSVTATEDSADDSFINDAKEDGLIVEGSPAALAVLSIVNTASESTLYDDVGLSSRAAHNIATHTSAFDTLAELDAVPYVGRIAFERLIAYARATGLLLDLPTGKLLDCNISFGVDQQVTVISDGSSLTLRELTNTGRTQDRALDIAEWDRRQLYLRSEYGATTTMTKRDGDWFVRESGAGFEQSGFADCWIDRSN